MFYDINGNRIYIVECENCGHQVGLRSPYPDDNPSLSEIERRERCCKEPFYLWKTSGRGIINNFSNP